MRDARRLQREVGIDAAISHVDPDALNGTPVPHRAPTPTAPGRSRGLVKFFNGGRLRLHRPGHRR